MKTVNSRRNKLEWEKHNTLSIKLKDTLYSCIIRSTTVKMPLLHEGSYRFKITPITILIKVSVFHPISLPPPFPISPLLSLTLSLYFSLLFSCLHSFLIPFPLSFVVDDDNDIILWNTKLFFSPDLSQTYTLPVLHVLECSSMYSHTQTCCPFPQKYYNTS